MNRNNAGNIRNYSFAEVPQVHTPRTRMLRPGSHITAINPDYLYPLYLDEVLPGDTFRLDVSTFARMTSAICPFMDNLYLDWQFFFVPCRLLWSNFQRFCGEQDNPTDSINYTIPYLTAPSGGIATDSIFDYMGIPTGVQWDAHDVSALPLRAYNLVYNQWYRDENLQNSVTVPLGDGPDATSNYTLLKRGKRKDYFTSCLPSPQKGTAVYVPLGSEAKVKGTGMALGLTNGTTNIGASMYGNSLTGNTTRYGQSVGTASVAAPSLNGTFGVTTDPDKSGLVADLSTASPISINALRQAFQMQKFFERLNRGGSRYIEILRSMFGVVSPDARLQRAELLTSFSVPVQLFQVAQTSASVSGQTAQGNLAATGTAASMRFAFNKSFVEHGYILGLASIRSDLTYQQGLHRMWSRSTRYDFYWPTFAHLGEQAVLNKEIYLQSSSVVDSLGNKVNDNPFGYQERWAEYKYGQHRVSGQLRSTASTPLDMWHLAQNFSSLPTLSSTFIEEAVPISRVLAISPSVSPSFVVQAAFNAVCVRPLPLYDIPGLVDHF